MKTLYSIWDARYLHDPEDAVCFSVCETLEEAKEESPDYGDGNVIVKETLKEVGENKFEVVKSEIVLTL